MTKLRDHGVATTSTVPVGVYCRKKAKVVNDILSGRTSTELRRKERELLDNPPLAPPHDPFAGQGVCREEKKNPPQGSPPQDQADHAGNIPTPKPAAGPSPTARPVDGRVYAYPPGGRRRCPACSRNMFWCGTHWRCVRCNAEFTMSPHRGLLNRIRK